MQAKSAIEGAALGLLSYAGLSLFLRPDWGVLFFSSLAGTLLGALYGLLRPYPWKRLLKAKTRACVSVHPKLLTFEEVSTKAPESLGFIRFVGMDKKDLFQKLQGKRINPATIPYHMRVAMEEKKEIEVPWEAIAPHLTEAR